MARLYTDQLKESEDYSTLEKVIGIHILNFTSILEAKKYHNVFRIIEKETGLEYFNELELHTIELKKFTDKLGKEFEDIGSKIQNSLDLWSAFLTRNDLLSKAKLPQSLDDAPVKKAIEVLSVMNFTDEEREAYEDHLKWLRIEANSLKKAEEKGREEGEKNKSLEIAAALLKQGLPISQISEATGLSAEELKSLQ